MSKKDLQPYMLLVDGIAKTFGRNCEVVLHDLSDPSKSIIKIANGHVTGRDVGLPLTDLGLSLYEKTKNNRNNDLFIGYSTKTVQGVDLKSTTLFIRNSRGKVIGSLCINIDITFYKSFQNILEDLCKTTNYDFGSNNIESPEKFASSVDLLIDELIAKSIKKIGKPLTFMDKEEKLSIVRELKERGLFLIKGSAKRVAKEIHVSIPTIYKYLEEI